MIALLTLLLLITLILIVSRVAAVALQATGLSKDSAQFQSRSALLGVGYTTSESEDITSHPVRRRIVLNLMTFGNASIITGIGSFLLTFVNAEARQTLERSLVLVAVIILLLLGFHSNLANRIIEQLTRRALVRFTSLDVTDYAALLQIQRDYAITELKTRAGEWIVDRPLSELHLTQEGVVVLGVHRAGGPFLGTPTGDTTIAAGDVVLAYGRVDVLQELARRPAGTGDVDHNRAAAEHQNIVREAGDDD